MSSLSLVSATAGAAAASGAAGASRYSSRWGKYLLFYVLTILNPLLSFHIIRDCAVGGSVLAFSRGKCVVFQAREETGRRQSFSPLLSVLTETLRDIFARAHTFGKCGAFMVEATSRLIDACRLNPSSGGGGGCRSAGGGGRSGNPGEEVCAVRVLLHVLLIGFVLEHRACRAWCRRGVGVYVAG